MKIAIFGLSETGSRFANGLNQAEGTTFSDRNPEPRYSPDQGVRLSVDDAEYGRTH